jgi:hypothetical protein
MMAEVTLAVHEAEPDDAGWPFGDHRNVGIGTNPLFKPVRCLIRQPRRDRGLITTMVFGAQVRDGTSNYLASAAGISEDCQPDRVVHLIVLLAETP